jgi:hypothetical protein
MAAFMFWNLGRSAAVESVASLCHQHEVDILVLAEAPEGHGALIRSLNRGRRIFREIQPDLPGRVRMFSCYPESAVAAVFDSGHVSIRHLTPPVGLPVLLVGVHLPSKLRASETDQSYYVRELRNRVEEAETRIGHRNSLIIGDLNANPFEPAIAAVDGLHGVMDKGVARRAPRTIGGKSWDYFYNPMWSRLGDESPGPPGTYYYAQSGTLSYYWNSFDQVLLRPELLPFYDPADLTIVTHTQGEPILGRDGRRETGQPDHLPIVVKLSIERAQPDG